jgi:biotin transport system substrate-specific component
MNHTHSATLMDTLVAGRETSGAIRAAAVVFMTALTAAGAQVTIPLTPVPFTLQPMVVLLSGIVLGSRLGMMSQVLYILIGIAGLPVFAASPLPQGILRLAGPTGGYLMAYPAAAFLTGWLAERGFDRRYLTSVLAMSTGLLVIFTFGVSWLAWFAQPVPAGFDTALRVGFLQFLPVDVYKILVAAAVAPVMWKLIGTRGSGLGTR